MQLEINFNFSNQEIIEAMEIDGLKVKYVGDYGKYKVYAPAEPAVIGLVLYLECDGKIKI